MAAAIDLRETGYTAADLHDLLGDMPLSRVRFDRPPGSATEDDVVALHDREDRLCELVEGVLVEKTVGAYEAYLALLMGQLLSAFVRANKLGFVLGADGMSRLQPGMIRIPDAAFYSWERFPNRKLPREPFVDLGPDLAVEIISPSNTRREMEQKLADYFQAGARAVWYVYPSSKTVRVFVRPDESVELTAEQTLDGGAVLPGFSLPLGEFFAEPE
jgi:Uma2 family endonuclease